MSYCSLAKLTADHDKAVKLEAQYMGIVDTYHDKDTVRRYPQLLAFVSDGVCQGEDVLGAIAAELCVLDTHNGQFFTPMEVCKLMSALTLPDIGRVIKEHGFLTISEPCAGSGAMIIAAAEHVLQQGFDPAHQMLVHAVELNRLSYKMTFIQLSLKDIPAYVEHANTLSLEHFDGAWTTGTRLFYERHGCLFPKHEQPRSGEPPAPTNLSVQFDLFAKQG